MKTVLSILFLIAIISAQSGPGDMGFCPPEDVVKRVETLKMWKLTEALDLTEEQAAVIFPAMREFREQQDSTRKRLGYLTDELRDKLISNADSTEILGIIDEILSLKRQENENELEFMNKTRSVLSAEQQAKYILFEQEFRKKMMKIIREMHRGRRREWMSDNPWDRP